MLCSDLKFLIDFTLLEIGSRKINKQLCYDNVLLHVIRHESIDFVSCTSVGLYCDVLFLYLDQNLYKRKIRDYQNLILIISKYV